MREEAGPTGAESLLSEALETWTQAQVILEEVKELRELHLQLLPGPGSAEDPLRPT